MGGPKRTLRLAGMVVLPEGLPHARLSLWCVVQPFRAANISPLPVQLTIGPRLAGNCLEAFQK
jgi:hypothetical protein